MSKEPKVRLMPLVYDLDRPNILSPLKVRDVANELFEKGHVPKDHDNKSGAFITGDANTGLQLHTTPVAAEEAIHILAHNFGTRVERIVRQP